MHESLYILCRFSYSQDGFLPCTLVKHFINTQEDWNYTEKIYNDLRSSYTTLVREKSSF